jgi:FAD/FMN-containing dehydrogenase
VYPELDRFLAVRAELDPHGLFLNDYFRELLGL